MIHRLAYKISMIVPMAWLVAWNRWRHGMKPFQPCAIEYDGINTTEILLKDCMTIWKPWPHGSPVHSVDLGYDVNGDLVGMRVWGRVIKETADS